MIGLAGIACVLLIILDQWVKYWAANYLKYTAGMDIINGVLGMVYVENRGAAFGLMQGGRWFFIPLTIAVTAGICVYYIRLPKEPIYWAVRIPLILILSGAVGNFIDRVRNGYVIDMFEFQFIRFPVFNVADMLLVTGTLILAFVFLFIIKETPKNG